MAPILEQDSPGFWGEPTATIDWCESNYQVTYYVAEFWNTVSNISMIFPPLLGAILAKVYGYEERIFWSNICLIIVGIGSWSFHGTLLYEMQLLDELPMIIGSSFLLYALIEVDKRRNNVALQLWMLIYCIIVTIVYVTINQPIFHEVAYGLLVICTVIYASRIARKMQHSGILFVLGIITYGSGFIVWNLDNIYCGQIREMRSKIPYTAQPLLQGHAWWHLLAGMGTNICILFVTHARLLFLNKPCEFKVFMGCLPYVRPIPKAVHQNGKTL